MRLKDDWYARLAGSGVVLFVALVFAVVVLARGASTENSGAAEGMDSGEAGGGAPVAASPIPVGTILPIKLDNALSAESAAPGEKVEAYIAQQVPLPNGKKIHWKAAVHGTVVSVNKNADGGGSEVSLRFDRVEYDKEAIQVTTSLRALASYEAVRTAQTPLGGADAGTPTGWGNTVQIGGDIRFGDGGQVRNRHKENVGKGVSGGVLVHVSAAPGSECEGPVNADDRLQALWVFSADACGVYDLRGVEIVRSGKTDPVGTITLRFSKEKMKLNASDGMLLRTVAPR
jgi:hypothetical protein